MPAVLILQRLVCLAPILHRIQNRFKTLTELRQGIFHTRRHFRKNLAVYKPVRLHIPKLCGQHLLAYAADRLFQFSKTLGSRQEIPQDQFTGAFGEIFDSSVHKITHVIGEGKVTIGGIDFIIKQTAEAFDIEIPEINAVYTHMLGHDCHSIVAGTGHADAMIETLKGYIEKGYDLILTSHYTPENLKDAETKIAYLENLKSIAAACQDADAFKAEVGRQYPQYSGRNYLDMTAGFFFA